MRHVTVLYKAFDYSAQELRKGEPGRSKSEVKLDGSEADPMAPKLPKLDSRHHHWQ
jgi:hypothetical protein